MRLKTGLQAFAIVLAVAVGAIAANPAVAGKWAGTIDVHDTGSGTDVSTPVSITFEDERDGAVSGKIGGNGEEVAIKNGKLNGGQLTFEASGIETSGPMKFTLRITGDEMEGSMKGAIDSQDVEGKVKLARQK